MNQKILDIFYHKVLPAAGSSQGITIDGFLFNASFILDSQVNDYEDYSHPVIQVKDKEKFNLALVQYTKSMLNFFEKYPQLKNIDYVYFQGDLDNMIEAATLNVWFNATEEDFRNPISFLEQRKNFLDDFSCMEEYHKQYRTSVIDGKVPCHFEYFVDVWNPSGNETPYVFRSSICDEEGNRLHLPNIGFGISNQNCYIYTIHNEKRKEELTSKQKKLNRLLYQADKDVAFSYEEESIKDISVSSLYSLTLFTSFIQHIGCLSMIAKTNFPIRNDAKLNNPRVDFQEFQKICTNSMNKFYRSFRRLSYHFPEVEVISYPFEMDNGMHLVVPDTISSQDDFIHAVYDSTKKEKQVTKS